MKLTTAFSSAYENLTPESSYGYLVLSKQAGYGLVLSESALFSAFHSFVFSLQPLNLKLHKEWQFCFHVTEEIYKIKQIVESGTLPYWAIP
jgi:hypothetical protein